MIDGDDLWVTINMNADWSSASTVVKIDMSSNTITETVEVGSGPQALAKLNGEIITIKLAIEPGAVFSGKCSMGPVVKNIKPESNPEINTKEKTA